MKKLSTLLLALLLLCSVCFAEAGGPFDVTLDPNYAEGAATTLTLDKGSNHGVELGDLVTTVDGMAGYVSELYSNTCEITTVIDVEMQCGALITRTRETAIAEGDYDLMADGNLRLSYLTEDTSVVIGDTVETSGRGGGAAGRTGGGRDRRRCGRAVL